MRVMITGCSSGFGRLSAESLADRGHQVFATMRDVAGRNAESAAALGTREGVRVFELDVCDEQSVSRATEAILAEGGGLDVVINNAGVAGLGFLEGYTAAKLRSLFEVNVFGVQRVCRATLPSLRASGGLLVFVSSTMGRVVVPCTAAYTASKFALEALAESYAYELAGHGVEVSIVEPGTHPTAIGAKMPAWGPDDAERVADYGPVSALPGKVQQGIVDVLTSPTPPDASAVGRVLVELVEADKGARPRRVVIDALAGAGPEAINQCAAQVQAGLLAATGLDALCGMKT